MLVLLPFLKSFVSLLQEAQSLSVSVSLPCLSRHPEYFMSTSIYGPVTCITKMIMPQCSFLLFSTDSRPVGKVCYWLLTWLLVGSISRMFNTSSITKFQRTQRWVDVKGLLKPAIVYIGRIMAFFVFQNALYAYEMFGSPIILDFYILLRKAKLNKRTLYHIHIMSFS